MGFEVNPPGGCANCGCVSTPAPCPGSSGGITGIHSLCWHPLDQQANIPPDFHVTVTGPGGYSATPTLTYVFSPPSTPPWSVSWTIKDLEPGDYTIVASGLRYITNTRTITITVRCGPGKTFGHTPRSKHVWCYIQFRDLTAGVGTIGYQGSLDGALVQVTGWRSATVTTSPGSFGSIGGGNLVFPDIQEPSPGLPDVVTVSADGHCTRVRCLVLSCQLSEFIYKQINGTCPSYSTDNSLDPPCPESGGLSSLAMSYDEDGEPLMDDDGNLYEAD